MVSDETMLTEMTQEDRLKAIIYQFITLYERWSEDRQVFMKLNADTADTLRNFNEEVKKFKTLGIQVRRDLIQQLEKSAKVVTERMSDDLKAAALKETKTITQQLEQSVQYVKNIIDYFEAKVKNLKTAFVFKTVLIAFSSMFTALFIFKFFMPAPTLPLTKQQIRYLDYGQMMAKVWPKLTKKEQDRWNDLYTEGQDANSKTD